MKKIFLVCVLFLMTTFSGFAQEVEPEWRELFPRHEFSLGVGDPWMASLQRHSIWDKLLWDRWPNGSLNDWFVYQKVWEDMFDALDWGGTMNCTVGQIYDDLEDYYNSGESNSGNYRRMYMQGGGNGYSSLNHFVRGGGRQPFNTRIRVNRDKAVHKEDFGFSADPFSGRYSGDDGRDTECFSDLYDVDT